MCSPRPGDVVVDVVVGVDVVVVDVVGVVFDVFVNFFVGVVDV